MRDNVRRNQRKNLLAAHNEIYGLSKSMVEAVGVMDQGDDGNAGGEGQGEEGN